MLAHLGIKKVSLMTNNPKKVNALTNLGIEVVRRQPIDHGMTKDNKKYLQTKTEKLGHEFDPHLFK
jgi:GTP cyclohydrolase II